MNPFSALRPIVVDPSSRLRIRSMKRCKRAIVRREIEPNQRLFEVEVARGFNASRTPVREAFRRLEQDGVAERLASGRDPRFATRHRNHPGPLQAARHPRGARHRARLRADHRRRHRAAQADPSPGRRAAESQRREPRLHAEPVLRAQLHVPRRHLRRYPKQVSHQGVEQHPRHGDERPLRQHSAGIDPRGLARAQPADRPPGSAGKKRPPSG